MTLEPGWDSFSTDDSLNSLYSSFTTEDSLSIQDLSIAFSSFDGDASSLLPLAIPATPEYITPACTTPSITTPSTAISNSVLITTSPTSTVSFTSQIEYPNSRHETVPTHTSRSPHLKTPKSNSPPALHSPASTLCETWLESYPHIFPKPKHIRALTDLTSEPALTIERLLNQRMRHPSSHHARHTVSAPPPAHSSHHSPSDRDAATSTPALKPAPPPLPPTALTALARSARKQKPARLCAPTADPELLRHDPEKPFQCTRGCGKRFAQRDDWRKHEELRWPQEGWVCLAPAARAGASPGAGLPGALAGSKAGGGDGGGDGGVRRKGKAAADGLGAGGGLGGGGPGGGGPGGGVLGGAEVDGSTAAPICARLSHRRQHFRQHFRRLHPQLLAQMAEYEARAHFAVQSGFDERCGFCDERMKGWRERVLHVGKHFQEGRDMRAWREGGKGEGKGGGRKGGMGWDGV